MQDVDDDALEMTLIDAMVMAVRAIAGLGKGLGKELDAGPLAEACDRGARRSWARGLGQGLGQGFGQAWSPWRVRGAVVVVVLAEVEVVEVS